MQFSIYKKDLRDALKGLVLYANTLKLSDSIVKIELTEESLLFGLVIPEGSISCFSVDVEVDRIGSCYVSLSDLELVLKKWRRNVLLSCRLNTASLMFVDVSAQVYSIPLVKCREITIPNFANKSLLSLQDSATLVESMVETGRTIANRHVVNIFEWVKWKFSKNEFLMVSCDSFSVTIKRMKATVCEKDMFFYLMKSNVDLMKKIIVEMKEPRVSLSIEDNFLIVEGEFFVLSLNVSFFEEVMLESISHSNGVYYDVAAATFYEDVKSSIPLKEVIEVESKDLEGSVSMEEEKYQSKLDQWAESLQGDVVGSNNVGQRTKTCLVPEYSYKDIMVNLYFDGSSVRFNYSGLLRNFTVNSISYRELNYLFKDSDEEVQWRVLIPNNEVDPIGFIYEKGEVVFERYTILTHE